MPALQRFQAAKFTKQNRSLQWSGFLSSPSTARTAAIRRYRQYHDCARVAQRSAKGRRLFRYWVHIRSNAVPSWPSRRCARCRSTPAWPTRRARIIAAGSSLPELDDRPSRVSSGQSLELVAVSYDSSGSPSARLSPGTVLQHVNSQIRCSSLGRGRIWHRLTADLPDR